MPILRNLKRVRERQALSQADLAARTHIATRSLSELERGLRSARPSTLRTLARSLNVTPAELIGDQERVA